MPINVYQEVHYSDFQNEDSCVSTYLGSHSVSTCYTELGTAEVTTHAVCRYSNNSYLKIH